MPLTMSYQARWWFRVDLSLDDASGRSLGEELNPEQQGSDQEDNVLWALDYSTALYKRASRGLPEIGCNPSRYCLVCRAAACASSAFWLSQISMIVK